MTEKEPVYVRYVQLTDKCRRALALVVDPDEDFKDIQGSEQTIKGAEA